MSTVSDYTSFQNASQRMKDSYDADRTQSDEAHQAELDKVKADYEAQLAQTRKELNQRATSERESAREEVQNLKNELYDSKGKKSASSSQDEQAEHKNFERYRKDLEKEASDKVKRAEEYADTQISKTDKRAQERVDAAVVGQKKSDEQQLRDLRGQVAIYSNEGHDVEKSTALAKAQAINEFEKGKIEEQNRIVAAYERDLARVKDGNADLEDRTNRRIAEISYAADAKVKEMAKAQKNDFLQLNRNQSLQNQYQQATSNNELKGEQLRNMMSQDHLNTKHANDTVALAKAKDQAYGAYLAKKSEDMDYEVSSRDEKIKELKTTADPLKASPYLVNKIREGEERRFTAQMNEGDRVHTINLEAEHKRDAEDRRQLTDEYRSKFTQANRGRQRQEDMQSKQFIQSYDDLKNLSQTQMANTMERAQRNGERIHTEDALALVETQQRNQEAMDEQRTQLVHEKESLLDQQQKGEKTHDRELALKFHDLRRSYDQNLSDAQDAHAKAMGDLRIEYDKKLRDMDRTSKRTLDDRVRAYEFQIKQQELAFKERERFLSEHYEEELDTMKRTNAHLIQKKS